MALINAFTKLVLLLVFELFVLKLNILGGLKLIELINLNGLRQSVSSNHLSSTNLSGFTGSFFNNQVAVNKDSF